MFGVKQFIEQAKDLREVQLAWLNEQGLTDVTWIDQYPDGAMKVTCLLRNDEGKFYANDHEAASRVVSIPATVGETFPWQVD